jgi:C1A family cysteine protease
MFRITVAATALAQTSALPGPAWTWNADIEKPLGEEDMGGFKIAVYTQEQQKRLSVDKIGNKKFDVDDGSIDSKTRFEAWKEAMNKKYETADIEAKSFATWLANDEIIQSSNARTDLNYKLGHNSRSDMTREQWAKFLGTQNNPHLRRPKNYDMTLKEMIADAPDSVDWTTKGAVTPIKNQEQCGSCWAFSTTGSVEGAYFLAQNELISLSEQELVSCDNKDNGCEGGLMDTAFQYVEQNGLCKEEDYPYVSGSGISFQCSRKTKCSEVVKVTGFTDVPSGDEDALKAAVAQQPVSVAVEADKSAFQLYKSGIMDSPFCGTKLDHGVLIVGYGTGGLFETPYWKVKNSWGTTFGEDGYIRLGRGKKYLWHFAASFISYWC